MGQIKHLAVAFVIILLVCTGLYAQNVGSINGTVRDPSGAVVAGAEVTALNTETGVETTTLNQADGAYTIPALRVGMYDLRASMKGFKTAEAKGLHVVVGETITIDLTLELGSVTQTTTVTAAATLVDTTTSALGTSRTLQEITDLPLEMASQGRAYLGWLLTVPGVAYVPVMSWADYNGLTRANIDGVGTSQFGNDYYGYTIDGVSGVSFANAGLEDAAAPIPDVVEEFRMSTNLPAESGANLGVQVDLVMKSGSNSFHGSVFEYFRNDVLDARPWFLANVAPQKMNHYGFALGGPIRKNHDFFFLSWDGFRMRNLPTGSDVGGTVASIPTQLMDEDNFSQWLGPQIGTDALGRPVYQGEIYDPTTTRTVTLPGGGSAIVRDPFDYKGVLNAMNPAETSTVSDAFAQWWPLPNGPGIANNYTAYSYKRHTVHDRVSFKIDHQIGSNQRLTFGTDLMPNKYVNYEGQFPKEINNSECAQQRLYRYRAIYSWAFRPDMLFTFRGGYVRGVWNDAPALCLNTDATYGATAGLKGVLAPYTPYTNISGISTIGDYWNLFLRIGTHVPINTDMSWTKGTHNLKWGADFDQQIHSNNNQSLTAGLFNFVPQETGLPGVAGTGVGYASYLLGAVDSATLDTPSTVRHLARRWGLYAQDQWRATRKLTVNYGLRWDIVNPLWESHDYIGAFSPTVVNPAAGGLLGGLTFWGTGPGRNGKTGSIYPIYWGALGPRLGIAYAFNDKTVLRAYYGLLYSPMNADFVQGESMPSYGSSASVTPSSTNNGVTPAFYWDNGFPNIIPPVPEFIPSLLNNSSVEAFGNPIENRPIRSQNIGFSLERTLPGEILLKVAYVGTLSHGDRTASPPLDQMPLNDVSLGSQLILPATKLPYPGFVGSLAQSLRPYPQYTGVTEADSTAGFSEYNSLQVTAQKRFKQGFNFLATYTFSKDLVNGAYQAAPLQNTWKTLGSLDRPQILNLSYTYQLPFGPGKHFLQDSHGVERQLVGGWEVSVIQNYYSGTPVVLSTDESIPGIGGVWANRVPGVPLSTGVGCGNYNPGDPTSSVLNINAFSVPAAYTFGNTSTLPNFRSCGYKNENVTVVKTFPVKENLNMRLGFEFYNIFNRHNWGYASTAGGGGLSSDVSEPASFGRYSGTSDPRTIQLYFRIEF